MNRQRLCHYHRLCSNPTHDPDRNRTERDTFGPIEVPADRLWGAQTQRSLEHFRISSEKMPPELDPRAAAGQARRRAASTLELGALAADKARGDRRRGRRGAGGQARRRVSAGGLADRLGHADQHERQRGARQPRLASSSAARAAKTRLVHPNDDVNSGQSSNDVFPTAMHVAAARGGRRSSCCRRCERCAKRWRAKAAAFRRHRQDRPHAPAGRDAAHAGPGVLRLRRAARRTRRRTSRRRCRTCCELAQGGTAVGTGLNAHPEFGARVAAELAATTGLAVRQRAQQVRGARRADALVNPHGALKTLAAALFKIANDVRWLACGPRSRPRRDHAFPRTSPAARSCRARSTRRSARR